MKELEQAGVVVDGLRGERRAVLHRLKHNGIAHQQANLIGEAAVVELELAEHVAILGSEAADLEDLDGESRLEVLSFLVGEATTRARAKQG